jgi:Cu+-exporting ATPase
VACPCAIALAVPFAFGTASRLLGEQGFYLKNTGVVESLARLTSVVFDKTGTITQAGAAAAVFVGEPLTGEERNRVASLVRNSPHPLSRAISALLRSGSSDGLVDFVDSPGEGIAGTVDGVPIRIGSAEFALGTGSPAASAPEHLADTRVFLSIAGRPRGHFAIRNVYREGVSALAARLKRRFLLHLLSGDTPAERFRLQELLGADVPLLFHQSPADKREFIRSLRRQGARVAMVGDGLNDAAALSASDAGIALTEDITAFSPACDAILEARALPRLDAFFAFSAASVRIVLMSFGVSVLYNIIGLTFAFSGTLSPLVAAVLMPVSSVSIIAFTTLSVRAVARRRFC